MDAQDTEIIRQLRRLDALTCGVLSRWDQLPAAPPPHEDRVLALLARQGLIEPSGYAMVERLLPNQGETHERN